MTTPNGTLGTGISVAATQIVLGQLVRKGATPLEAIKNTLEMYERIRRESNEPITAGEEARTEYLKGELINYLPGCPRGEIEDVKRLIGRVDTLIEGAPLIESGIEMYGIVFKDKTGEPQIHICTLAGEGDYDRTVERLEEQGNDILYRGRRIGQDEIDTLSRFSIMVLNRSC